MQSVPEDQDLDYEYGTDLRPGTPRREVPILDLNDLHSADPETQAAALAELDRGFRRFGVVYVKNSGLTSEDLEDFYRVFLAFTDLPREVKEKVSGSDVWFQRGWMPPSTERSGGTAKHMEAYFAATSDADPRTQAMFPQIQAPNRWPDGWPRSDELREKQLAISRALQRVAVMLLRGACHPFAAPGFTSHTTHS